MNENNKDFETEYDSLKDVIEFQKNMYNPGYYVGTGKIPPTVSVPGNATPAVVLCFFATILFLSFGLFLFFSNVNVTSSGLIESALGNKIFALIIMIVVALFFLILGFSYLRKAKKYYREKAALKNKRLMIRLKIKFGNEPVQNAVNPTISIIQNVLIVNSIIMMRMYVLCSLTQYNEVILF